MFRVVSSSYVNGCITTHQIIVLPLTNTWIEYTHSTCKVDYQSSKQELGEKESVSLFHQPMHQENQRLGFHLLMFIVQYFRIPLPKTTSIPGKNKK